MKGVIAAGGTAALIAATTAFAPVGIVGAAGWTLVYWVFGGTVTIDSAIRLWKVYKSLSTEKKQNFDDEMERLKRMLDNNVITKEEFSGKAKKIYDKYSS